jgi:cell division topological specificity factor
VEFLKKFLRFGASSSTAEPDSKEVAKERLKLALTYDRGDLPRDTIEQLRDAIIQLIVKHLAIDAAEVQISFDRTQEHDKLIASIPLRKARRPRPQVAAVAAGQGNTKPEDGKVEPHRAPQRRRRR